MSTYTYLIIRDRDANGELQSAGYQWSEQDAAGPFFVAAVIILPLGLIGVLWPSLTWTQYVKDHGLLLTSVFDTVIVGSCLVMIVFVWRTAVQESHRSGAVVFNRKGGIWLPFGAPDLSPRVIDNVNITSIESTVHERTAAVNIYVSDGRRLLVASWRRPDEARMIVVQLNKALQEIRAATTAAASPSGKGPSQDGRPSPEIN